MRISDWSSDVCSSDLVARARGLPKRGGSRSLAALESARGSGEMGMRARSGLAAALAVGLVIGGMATPVGVAAQEPSDDRHAGYYYPAHGTPEVYDARDRKSGGEGKRVSGRVGLGGRRITKKKK